MLTLIASLAFAPAPALAQGPSEACQRAPTPGDSALELDSGGLHRTADVFVPAASAGQRLPVLVALRGEGAVDFAGYSGFSAIAAAEGFIVVYPEPIEQYGGHTFWNIDASPAGPNDVEFISDLLDELERSLCVDPARVYAAGVSNGGGMAALLACQLSSRFAAIASIAGGYSTLPPCQPAQPLSVLEIHGSADGVAPYDGARGTRAGAVLPWLAAWRARDGCGRAVVVGEIAPRVERYRWSDCAQGTSVERVEILGGGHQLPGALPPDPGQTGTVSAPWLAWSFLGRHALPAV
jgi:polyhydroxybutyrate depolymerase